MATKSGGPGNDSLIGTTGRDRLIGNAGNDRLFGGAASDILEGGAGSDTLFGGTGNDRMVGGAGNDLYVVNQATDQTLELDGAGLENLTLTGTAAINGTGNDRLLGGGGNDRLFGEAGADVLIGGAGNDVDSLAYLATTDGGAVTTNVTREIAGVSGDSVFGFAAATDQVTFAIGAFNAGGAVTQGALTDGIDFATINTAYDGTNHGTSSEADAGRDAWIYSTADDTLYYDANGSADGYVVVATFAGNVVLTADDIVIV